MLPVGRSVRPIVSRKRASPVKTKCPSGKTNETPPIEWPGVGNTKTKDDCPWFLCFRKMD